MSWSEFAEVYPFFVSNNAASEVLMLRGLVRVGFGRRHAEYKVFKQREYEIRGGHAKQTDS